VASSNEPGNPVPEKQLEQDTSLYETPKTALESLVESYHYWGEKLTDSSFALCVGVIGANWAVFGSFDKIRGNLWSELSLSAVVVALGTNLVGMKLLAEAHRERIEYAEANEERWKAEFKAAKNTSCPWPSTDKIDRLAKALRECRTYLPLLGGVLFIVALVCGQVQPKADSAEALSRLQTKLDSMSDALKRIDGKLADLKPAAAVQQPAAAPSPSLTPTPTPTPTPTIAAKVRHSSNSKKRWRATQLRAIQAGSPTNKTSDENVRR
jgi:hypothetical protein